MSTLTVTLGSLIDRALLELESFGERGLEVVIGSTALTAVDTTSMTLVNATAVNESDVLEFGSELVLVTAKSSDAVPVFTVSRGYFNTTPATHAAGTVGNLNPTHPRFKVAEAVRRAFSRLESLGLPLVKNVTKTRIEGYSYCEMPSDCRDVYQVLYWGEDGRLLPLAGWQFFNFLPVAKFSTGKALNLGRYVADDDELEVIYRAPYRWSTYPTDPDEAATIEITEGAEDLPVSYAVAWTVSSREISRSELDRSEEWGKTEGLKQGQSGALVRARWQEFYRALDEARRLEPPPTPITYHARPKF